MITRKVGAAVWRASVLCILISSNVSAQNIDADVTVVASYLGELMNETLGVSKVQEKVNTLTFERFRIDGEAFVRNLSARISSAINLRLNAVRKIKRSLEASMCENANWNPCCRYDRSLLQQNENYKTEIDPLSLCEVIAPTAPEFFCSLAPAVLKVMQENRELVPDIKWQYVGTEEGILTLYPALRVNECGKTDPRFRPWYIETARPTTKHVLILLDNSRSMLKTLHSQKLVDISTESINVLLDTLTPIDRIGMVTFNNEAQRPSGCFQDQLALATQHNIKTLKENFLLKLQPQGESAYTVGFQNAFDLLYSCGMKVHNQSNDAESKVEYVVLFITDGEPKELYGGLENVYKTIEEGNKKINNSAVIYTFGLGRDANMSILDDIATQATNHSDMSSAETSRHSYHITDPVMLQHKLTSFYRNYGSERERNRTTFSVPYVDSGGLGLIFTVGMPVYKPPDMRLFGVAAVDISLQEVFTDALYYDSGGDSYIFVIDGSGRVITHPLMPRPTNETDQPKFVEISELERHHGVEAVIASMMAGESGNMTLEVQKVLPVGSAVQTSQVTVTYFWQSIISANFSVCYVLETMKYEVGITPQEVFPIVPPNSSFRYHRLELDPNAHICRHFYHKSTASQSTVLFAPRCFRSPLLYESSTETEESVARFYRMFDGLFAATSTAQIDLVLQQQSATAELFAPDVVADVMWTSIVDKLWVNKTDDHVARRYIGTSTGVDRLFPGTRLPMDFDVTKRVWYELAVANPHQAIFSTPYKDAAGAGNVISISQAILTPLSDKERKVIGVMGVDFSLNHLYSVLLDLYPQCKNGDQRSDSLGWSCILVDDRGNIILHKDYLDNNEQNKLRVKHISSDGTLMSTLHEKNFVQPQKCLDLDQGVYRNWYKLQSDAQLNESYFLNAPRCSQYFMAPVPKTNIFFLARQVFPWCSDFDCPAQDTKYICENVTYNCPCSKPVKLDTCGDTMIIEKNVPACFPARPELTSFRECIPEYLLQCNAPQCKNSLNSTSCSGVVGCVWCHQTQSGNPLEEQYCEESEQCYNGLKDNRLPGYESSEVCEIKAVGIPNEGVIAACVCGSLLLIFIMALMIYWQRRVRRKRKEIKLQQQEREYDEVPISPQGNKLGASPPSSPQGKMNGYSRKHSNVPQVILSVVDTDGSEIIRKPVQLVKAGKTIGAPAPDARRPSHDFDLKKTKHLKKNGAPKTTSVSSNSSKDEANSSSEEDSGRPRNNSGISDNSSEFVLARTHKRAYRTPDILRTPVLRKIRHNNDKHKRQRTQTEPSQKQANWENKNPVYLASRSISSDQINKVAEMKIVKDDDLSVKWKSADDMLRYSTLSVPVRSQQDNKPTEASSSNSDKITRDLSSYANFNFRTPPNLTECNPSHNKTKQFQVFV